jgi:hypothetical protein
MAKIRQSNLDDSIVTGLGELTSVASGDQTIIYDASTSTLKKISQTNFLNFPVVSSVSPTSVTSGDGTGNYTFTITGTGFTAASASLVNNSGSIIAFDTVTVDSTTQITGVIAKSSLPGSGEPYDVKVTAANGLSSTLENQINIDQSPTFNTASGSLGTVLNANIGSTNLDIVAFDPESAGNVTFEVITGSLPAGASSTTVNEDGVSKFRISGFSAVGSNTTSTFTVRAADVASNVSTRQFSITVNAPVSESFTSSGTFSVPAGITSVDVLVVAGGGAGAVDSPGASGGGGAGGLIFRPGFPVTPGGTITVTVGNGGGSVNSPNNGNAGQDSVFGTLTAKGGGAGTKGQNTIGGAGGSGGGPGEGTPGPFGGGPATQPTQPGDSGTYGFGNPGGNFISGGYSSGGGGGAGGAGADGGGGPGCGTNLGCGGIGRAYTIADGTTPVYYAGGGGSSASPGKTHPSGNGGQGGGGNGAGGSPSRPGAPGANAQANTGGGGGGSTSGAPNGPVSGQGGKGIVIVRY